MITPVTINTMRQSTMTTADTCLHRIEHMQNPDLPKHGSVNRSMGTGYHGGEAEYYAMRRMGEVTDMPNEQQMKAIHDAGVLAFREDVDQCDTFDWRFQPKTYRLAEVTLTQNEAELMVRNLLTRYFEEGHFWQPAYEVVGVEQRFEMPFHGLNGWTRSGTIDLILWSPRERYVLDDHKTSKKKWDKKKGSPSNPQAAWYIDAWREYSMTEAEIIFVYSVMGFDGSFERRLAPRNEKHIEVTLRRARDLARLIEQGGPFLPNTESFLCSEAYCDYWSVCDYGKTLNFVDQEG